RRGVLDFQDLLLKARNLVRDSREVRGYFQRRFRYLLVDEFQDTDPLQAELIFFLAEKGATARTWTTVELDRDRLFLVGDPKQSIYRFRRADIRIYKQAREMMEAINQRLVISQNFRSSPSVLAAVNRIFEAQMVDDGDLQAGYVPLDPEPGRPDAGPGLVLLFPPDGYEPGKMPEYRKTEAELIAQFVQHICRESGPVKIFDRSTKKPRAPVFGDVAVLFPVSTDIEYYEDALRARGFPLQVEAGGQFYVRRETLALFSVLNAVDNPEDSVAVVAALRSPFFGLSDEDLFLYRHAGGQFNYLHKGRDGFPRMTESFVQLRHWHELRATASLAALVDAILDESGALAFFLLLPGGQQAVANLLRIVELARRFEQEPGACLRTLVAMLEHCAASELAETDAVLGDDQENAVKLVTIHRAKGLEFPVVILAGMACQQSKRKNVLVDAAAGRIGFQLGNEYKTADYDALALRDDQRGTAEDLRLFYVAATRARDCLVIPRMAPLKTDGARFLPFYKPLDEFGSKPQRSEETGERVLLLRAEDMLDSTPTETAKGVFLHDIGSKVPPNDLIAPILAERAAWKQELAELGVGRKAAAEPESLTEKEWQARANAAVLGTTFHHIMRQVDLGGEAGTILDTAIERGAHLQGVEKQSEKLKEWVKRTLSSPWLQRARAAKHVWREMPFCIDHQGQIMEGSMDLLFEEADGLVLVDYKTEDVRPGEIAARIDFHRPQLEAYRDAICQLTGKHLSEAALYFVQSGIGQVVKF
ncbi:MAG: UvrD-helicase domain-containing protein, partial [Terriglobales bacterium]